MHDSRHRPARPAFKSQARLAAEAAFSATPLRPPAVQPAPRPAPDAKTPLSPPATPAVHVVRRRLPEASGGSADALAPLPLQPSPPQATPSEEAATTAQRAPRVHVLRPAPRASAADLPHAGADDGGASTPLAAAADGPAGSPQRPVRRRPRQQAPAVTIVYRAEPRPPAAPDTTGALPGATTTEGAPRSRNDHIAALQAAIDADVNTARQAAAFSLDGLILVDEWSRLDRALSDLADDVMRSARMAGNAPATLF